MTSVGGLVTDPSGAVVERALISLKNPAAGITRQTRSDEAGRYLFAQVPPGNYEIGASASGFNDVVITGITLLVSSPGTVNIAFSSIGTVAETVSVTANTVQVNTTDATIGNAFGASAITQLPLEGRNVVGLLALQPGVVFIGEEQMDSRNGAVNGGRSDQANVTLDGIDVNDHQDRFAFTSVLRVTLDSVQEFRVTTSNASADRGRGSGAQIELVTRSGTNDLHGSAYEYHRNTVTTANSFFNNSAQPSVERPKLIRNTFGVSLGGPARRNRLFYFLNYEGRRDAREDSVERLVPTESFRTGTLKYIRTDNSIGELTPEDLRTRVDPAGIGVNAEVLKLFQSYPLPNSFNSGDTLNTAGYRFKAPVGLRWNTYIARLDYNLTPNGTHGLFLRGNLQNDRNTGLPQFPGDPPSTVDLTNSKGLAASYNAVFRPNLIGTFRYGFTRQGVENSGLQTASAVRFRTLDDRYALTTAFTRITPVHHTTQDLTWVKGAHSVQFGGVQRWIRNSRVNYASSFHFAQSRASWLENSGSNLERNVTDLASRFRTSYQDAAAAILGIISQGTANYNYDLQGNVLPIGAPVSRRFANNEYELYVRDTWRASREWTITGGIRWSLMPPVYETNGMQIAMSPSAEAWFNERSALASSGRPQSEAARVRYVPADDAAGGDLYPFHKRNFGPHLAIAYSPQSEGWKWLTGGPGQSVIRAGWGMYYDLFGQGLIRYFDSNSFGLSSSIQNASSTLTELTAPRFTGVFDLPSQLIPPAPPGGFPVEAPDVFAFGGTVDSRLRPPYTMEMNFSVAREFPGGFYVQAAYVGRLSRRSLVQSDIAAPTNLTDPKSGMSYFEAAGQLAQMGRQRVPVEQVGAIPFWENLWPGAAGAGLTATQRVYQRFLAAEPDYTAAIQNLDIRCQPACSIYGPYAMFNRQFSSMTAWRSIANGSYHAMQWTLRKRLSRGVQFDVNYTWSKSIDLASRAERDAVNNLGIIPNPWDPGLRRAVSDYDMTHQFNANWIIELPFGRGKKWLHRNRGIRDAVAGGWQWSGIWRQTSGLPISVSNGRIWPTNWQWQANATQVGPVPAQQTTKNAPAPVPGGFGGPNVFADPAAALAAYDFTYPGGVGQRNGIRGDGYFTIDMGLAKRFYMPYSEKHSLQFRWEVFNATNSVRFDVRNLSLSLGDQATFGRYFGVLTSPRVMQFGLRYEF
ncbi:MAG TPA: carboxypeptidase-like regulatory domain-containing protein [Bryobacteraceae bacterium]|nr:carboxypeptidase-like regulatory domain-containing protein [Bryobacteraceae bacterium]